MPNILLMARPMAGANVVDHVYLTTEDGSLVWNCHGQSSDGTTVAVLQDADIEAAVRFCPPGEHVIKYGVEGIAHQEANQILAAATRPGSAGIVIPGTVRGIRSSYFIWGVYGRKGHRHLRPSDFGLAATQHPESEQGATLEEPIQPTIASEQESRRILVATGYQWDQLIAQLCRKPEEMRKLDPRKFEELVAELLSREGLDVELTPRQKDGGRDVLAYQNTSVGRHLFLVECKRYSESHPVDVGVVRSLYGVVEYERATAGVLVTTSRFTTPAQEFQQTLEHRMSLRDYKYLCDWLKQHAKA